MKHLKHLWILILLFGLVSMSACGSPSDEPEPPQNQQVMVDCAQAVAAHQYLLKQHEELKADNDRLRAREVEFSDAVRTLENANLAQGIELAILKELDNWEDYERVLNELVSLKAEKKDWGIFAEKEYARILKQYEEMDALYPLKNFPDKETLVTWRDDSGNITEDRPLWALQKLARDEGYLVVVAFDIPYGMVIVEDYWYKITSDNKSFVEKLGKVE